MTSGGWPTWPSGTDNGGQGTAIIPVEPTIIDVTPTPPKAVVSPRLRLSTIGDCKREIAKLYREVRRGETSSTEAGKLVWMLNTLANLIADHDIEARLEALEQRK